MNISTNTYKQGLRRYYRLPAVQVSLTLVMSLFGVAIFVIFALKPTIVAIATLRKTITESEASLKKLEAKVIGLQKASKQLDELKPFLPAIDASIPNKGAVYSPLTTSVEILANQTGVKIESESLGPTLLFSRILSPFAPSKDQSVIALPFSVRVTGSYQGVTEFLTQLLSMERIIMIESMSIAKEAAGKNVGGVVSLNISGSAYYLANESQLKTAISEKKGKK